MKQTLSYHFGQSIDTFSESRDYLHTSLPSSPISSSEYEFDNSPERDTSNSDFNNINEFSPDINLCNVANTLTPDSVYSNNEVQQSNNQSYSTVIEEEEHDDPLKIDYYISKIDRCSFCNRKKYYYDLVLVMKSIKDKSNIKICLNCALDTIDDKRKMRDVEFKCSRKNMIKPYKCKKCHAYRSFFRFKLNKKDQLQYCSFCAKKKYFTLHKKNHKQGEYVSYYEKILGDPETRNN